MAWRCGNPTCPRYGGTGSRLRDADVYSDRGGNIHCATCHAFVARIEEEDESAAKAVAGAGGGALVGWTVAGPPGALVGGLVGLIVGLAAGEKKVS